MGDQDGRSHGLTISQTKLVFEEFFRHEDSLFPISVILDIQSQEDFLYKTDFVHADVRSKQVLASATIVVFPSLI